MGPFWPPNVDKMKAKRDIEGLIKALGHRKVREAAADALVRIGEPAVKPLIGALKDGSESVRTAAEDALLKIGEPTVEPLIAALNDRSGREAAAGALDKMGWHPGQDENGAAYWVVKKQWNRCIDVGTPAIVPLSAALKAEDWEVQAAAAGALGQIGDAGAVEPLLAALKANDSRVGNAAARALGQIGDPRAVGPLVAALEDDRIGAAAARALGQIGDAHAVDPLVAAHLKYTAWVRHAVALAKAGTPAVCAAGDWAAVSAAAAEALGQIADPRAIEPLTASLNDRDNTKWSAAPLVVPARGTASRFSEMNAASALRAESTVREAAAEALEQIGRTRQVHTQDGAADMRIEDLIRAIQNSDASVALGAGSELATRANSLGDAVIEPLLTAVDEPEMLARYRLLKSSGQWRNDPDAGLLVLELTKRVLTQRGLLGTGSVA